MKRCWFGAGLLLALLAVCIGAMLYMSRRHETLSRDMERAAAYAMVSDWPRAEAVTAEAWKKWDAGRQLTAALSHHGPLEEIDSLFAQLEVSAAAHEESAYAALCIQLSQMAKAVSDTQTWDWWNIL